MRLEFGGKEFDLKPLNGNDMVELEEAGVMFSEMSSNPTIKSMRRLIYQMIKKLDPSITEEWVGEQMTMDNMEGTMTIIGNFLKPKE